MNKIGIICEYNPFHNGHLYHLQKIKEMYPTSLIVLVMSSSFTQRGDISILNKWEKTDIALHYGVDLVVELPFVFASQSADVFSKGAITLLNLLQVNTLVFGSESNNPKTLFKIADIQLNNSNYDCMVKKYLDQGQNYPTSMSEALQTICGTTVNLPNDLLGLSYVKEIMRQQLQIDVVTIKRTNDFHGQNLDQDIISASAIRNNINDIEIEKYVPAETYKYLKNKNYHDDNYFSYLKYKIILEQDLIKQYQTVDEGIENRIITYINEVNNLDELIHKVKTKRYTYNKLHRMFTHILCGLTKKEATQPIISYIRILGFSNQGKKYLNAIKKEITVPIITNYKKEYHPYLKLETRIDHIYSLIMNDSTNDPKRKPIYYD